MYETILTCPDCGKETRLVADDVVARANEAEVRVARLEEALRISYPMTPVDCLISELRELADADALDDVAFEDRVAAFKDEVLAVEPQE